MDYTGLWIGLVGFFLIPTALFGWSVYSKRGQAAHERAVEEAQRIHEGLPPLPPRTAFGRWARAHPWTAAVAASCAGGGVFYVLGVTAFDESARAAALRALFYGAEILALGAIQVTRQRRRQS